ncbi:unnamed protein product [Cylindrotheca closterium]|uniref:Uncharacterized protein n=1 Tax=Cylindrotheca closterium TaxID=2856 RepID=A0AAD2FVE6_9STRA|nr:unnamed protein product [Cylindrotheca closterium]
MPEKHGKSSEVYKELLHDFMNFKQTGWKPFGPNIGGVEHMKSKTMYEKKMASRHAFRSLAKKVAADAVGLLPSSFIEDEGAQEDSDDDDDDDEGENKAARSSSANAASTSRKTSSSKPIDLTCQAAKEDVDGRILGFEVGQMRQHYLLQYPTGNKLGVVCCLDGDVEDRTSNQFKLSNDA